MLKSVLKEIVILVLLSIAILLILGIIFYDYIPINVTIPEKAEYVTPESVQNELNEILAEGSKTEVTYEITDSDLNIYKQRGNYDEGKANPFALEENNTVTTSNTITINGSTSNSNNNSSNINSNINSVKTNNANNTNNTKNNNSSNNSSNSNNNNSNTKNTNEKSESTGTFFKDEGIK